MTITQTTLPIEYWNKSKTRLVSPRDENGRKVELGYFYNVQFVGHSIHYPQPLLYSHHTGKLSLPTIEKFMSLEEALSMKRRWSMSVLLRIIV